MSKLKPPSVKAQELLRKTASLLQKLPRRWELTVIKLTGDYLAQLALTLGQEHNSLVGFLMQCSEALEQYVVEYEINKRKRPTLDQLRQKPAPKLVILPGKKE